MPAQPQATSHQTSKEFQSPQAIQSPLPQGLSPVPSAQCPVPSPQSPLVTRTCTYGVPNHHPPAPTPTSPTETASTASSSSSTQCSVGCQAQLPIPSSSTINPGIVRARVRYHRRHLHTYPTDSCPQRSMTTEQRQTPSPHILAPCSLAVDRQLPLCLEASSD
jgi:hypothetical protein